MRSFRDQAENYMVKVGYQKGTQISYLRWIERFTAWCHRTQCPVEDQSAVAYMHTLTDEENLSSPTVQQARCALKMLLRDVLKADFLKLKAMELPHRTRPRRRVLTRAEISEVISLLPCDHAAALSLMVGSGARVEECMAVRRKHILLRDEVLFLPARGRTLARTAPLDGCYISSLEYYLCHWSKSLYARRGWLSNAERAELFIFPTAHPRIKVPFGEKPLRSRTFQRLFKYAADEVFGPEHHVTPDTLRWTYAVTAYTEGRASVEELQMILGHHKLETTYGYLFLDPEEDPITMSSPM